MRSLAWNGYPPTLVRMRSLVKHNYRCMNVEYVRFILQQYTPRIATYTYSPINNLWSVRICLQSISSELYVAFSRSFKLSFMDKPPTLALKHPIPASLHPSPFVLRPPVCNKDRPACSSRGMGWSNNHLDPSSTAKSFYRAISVGWPIREPRRKVQTIK